MAKIYQGELPKTINVVVKGKIIAVARFVNGVYETENSDVIAELKRYGYDVEEVKEPEKVKDEPKPKTKPAKNKKKDVK